MSTEVTEKSEGIISNVVSFVKGVVNVIVNAVTGICTLLAKAPSGITFCVLFVVAVALHTALHFYPGLAILLYAYVIAQIAALCAFVYFIWFNREFITELFTSEPRKLQAA